MHMQHIIDTCVVIQAKATTARHSFFAFVFVHHICKVSVYMRSALPDPQGVEIVTRVCTRRHEGLSERLGDRTCGCQKKALRRLGCNERERARDFLAHEVVGCAAPKSAGACPRNLAERQLPHKQPTSNDDVSIQRYMCS